MRFVREHSNIPVQEVLGFDPFGNIVGNECLIMSDLPGKTLEKALQEDRSPSKRDAWLASLADVFVELQKLRLPRYGSFGQDMEVSDTKIRRRALFFTRNNLLETAVNIIVH